MTLVIDMGMVADDWLAQTVRSSKTFSGNTPGHARTPCVWWKYVNHYLPDGRLVRQWFNYLGTSKDPESGQEYDDYDEYIEVEE